MSNHYDYVIIGAGIIGLSIARALKQAKPDCRILIIDKEHDTAYHASGRNSGVLHAGFYYSADSFKAKFTVEGNKEMKAYCRMKGIPVNECGKLVVAQDAVELEQLNELKARGDRNGSDVRLIDEAEAKKIEPNIRTYQKALFSPNTASIDPVEVCYAIKDDLRDEGVEFQFSTKYLGKAKNCVKTNKGDFTAGKIINCAGLYADKVAQDFGLGQAYTMLPFKGLYLRYTKNNRDVRVNIYPVPNLRNPFLGVHFTKTVSGEITIGPTAIPAFWRENYAGFYHFQPREWMTISGYMAKLLLRNSFNFRDLAIDEMKKYNKKTFINLAAKMVQHIDKKGFGSFTKPGIRAQLLNKRSLTLVQDFVVESDKDSVHVLNAVSPAFTCAFPFARYVVQDYIL